MRIVVDDLSGPAIADFLAAHVAEMRAVTPAESKHALDLDGLRRPEITFWTALDDDADGGPVVVGCAALKRLDATHGELKSMRVDPARRGSGIGLALLRHVLDAARAAGMTRLSLETGTDDHFAAARALYARNGFEPCDPFGGYPASPHNTFLTHRLG